MQRKISIALSPNLKVEAVSRSGEHVQVAARGFLVGRCPACQTVSRSRHSRYTRTVQDLPVQGTAVKAFLKLTRWRCQNHACRRVTFSEAVPDLVRPYARRSCCVGELVRLVGHSAGARPGARLLGALASPASKDTILRSPKRSFHEKEKGQTLKIIGIDDWSWRKGSTYVTISVDLESHLGVDVLAKRSSTATVNWLQQHLGIEVICRDRCGLYAQGAQDGAPQAKSA